MFNTLDIQEDSLRVSHVAYQLREDARYWWCQASTTVEENWEAFREAFLDQYIPDSACEGLRDEFQELIVIS